MAPNLPPGPLDLRQRAEAEVERLASWESKELSPESAQRALHELQVHQVELVMQNEELRRAHEELDSVRARYFDLYERAPAGYVTVSEDGLILEANCTAASLLGAAREALAGQPIARFILPEDQDIYVRHCNWQSETGPPQQCEVRLRCNDGGPFWALVTTTLGRDADGARVRRTLLSDITERKRAQVEHQQALARQVGTAVLQQTLLAADVLEDKLKRVTDAVVRLFDADFCRIWLVRRGDRCTQDCCHGSGSGGLQDCRDQDRCLHLLASSGRYIRTDGGIHSRVPLVGVYKIGQIASGEEHKFLTQDAPNDPAIQHRDWARQLGLVSFAGYRLRVPEGEVLGVMALFSKHPIPPTEDALLDGLSSTVALVVQGAIAKEAKDRAEAGLHQAQKMEAVGRLAGGVAHDFNNLLTVILGQAELAASQLGPADPLRAGLHGIEDAGIRAASLTRQLLAFARQQVVCPRTLDLNGAVAGMLKLLGRLIGEDIQLIWKPGAKVWPVYLDPSQVDQLLANLVVNARDAIPNTGTVVVGTATAVLDEAYCAVHPGATPGEYTVLSVSDTGVGMDRDTQARIFEPFFTTKERGKGTGLGLATVYGIVKQAGGSVYVYSEPGQGTTLRLYLPRWRGGGTAAVIADATPCPARGDETVLLVEDDLGILELGQRILERSGYRVLPAGTPGDALLLAEREPGTIHLLATDVILPGMNGRDLWERLQVQCPGVRCLYLSGYSADVIAQRGILPEGVNFLQKPFSLKDLAAKVRAVLDAPAAVGPGAA